MWVTRVYVETRKSTKPIVIELGGARSSKSHSIGQRLVEKFLTIKRREILVTRKYGPALTRTAARLIVNLLNDYGAYNRLSHNKTEGTIFNPNNGARFSFFAIDDPLKVKSTEFNDAWMEEADEFTWDDFSMVRTRMSAPASADFPNQIFLSLNPDDEQGWANQKIILNPAFAGLFDLIRSTYKDNPFLEPSYIKILEDLAAQDPVAHQIYALGQWGTLTNLIYRPYTIVPRLPDSFDEVIYGLDFGFNNPTALIRIGIKDVTNKYLEQKLYQTGLTNGDLIQTLATIIPESERACPIYADCAEPDRIEELSRAGWNVHPSDKEVKAGIDFCKRQTYYALASSTDLNKERASYKWKTDRNGNVLDEPVKFLDHLMDAKRYAIFTHEKSRQNQPGIFIVE